jgi:hypothetical protein
MAAIFELPPHLRQAWDLFPVAKEETRRLKEGGRGFRNTRSIKISSSSVCPMLGLFQEKSIFSLARRAKLSRSNK